jgi:hypothetical protein
MTVMSERFTPEFLVLWKKRQHEVRYRWMLKGIKSFVKKWAPPAKKP